MREEALTRRSLCRYILSLSVIDFSGQMWLTCFNDTGEMLLGIDANQVEAMRVRLRLLSFPPSVRSLTVRVPLQAEGEEEKIKEIVGRASGSMYNFRCSGKMDTFGVSLSSPLSLASIRWTDLVSRHLVFSLSLLGEFSSSLLGQERGRHRLCERVEEASRGLEGVRRVGVREARSRLDGVLNSKSPLM